MKRERDATTGKAFGAPVKSLSIDVPCFSQNRSFTMSLFHLHFLSRSTASARLAREVVCSPA